MVDVFIHPLAVVDEGAQIGEGTKVWHFAHIRSSANIGSGCIIGKDVYVDANVVIGNNVKIQNGVSVYQGVTIEDDVFCGPHMTFSNDLYPRAYGDSWEITDTLVKRGSSIGANATILCGITLGNYSMVGIGAVVTKDVPAHALVVGNPARIVGFVCKCGQPLKDEVQQQKVSITFACGKCKEEITVSMSDYKKMVR
ncbi:MAG: DapH/DapD/GlmU-related protein [Candidatus Thorarchaeota archaeon]|jgi:acetyltransferase-like isoleucine patch superfamily enzyme